MIINDFFGCWSIYEALITPIDEFGGWKVEIEEERREIVLCGAPNWLAPV